jgi:hypothetical protein
MTNTARDVELLLIDAGWIQAADKRTGEPAPFLQGNSRLFVINAIHGKTEYAIGGGEGQAHATPLDAAHYLISMIQPAEPEPEPVPVEEYVAPQIIEAITAEPEPVSYNNGKIADAEPVIEEAPEPNPRDAALAAAEAELAALRARVAELEARDTSVFSEAPLLPAPDALMSDYGPVDPKDAETIIDGFAGELRTSRDTAEGTMRSMDPPDRRRLFSILNTELGRLKNQEALLGKSIPRRADCEELIGILAKVGEA